MKHEFEDLRELTPEQIMENLEQLEAENKRLKEALEKIHAKSYPGLAMSVFTKESTMLNSIYRFATQALKGE